MAGLSCNCVLPSPEMRKWNEIIKKNMLNGDAIQAMVTYVNVQEIGFHADNFTFPILLKAAGRWSSPCIGSHRCVADACKVFEKMPVKDVVAWNSILDAYAATGKMDDALKVFNSMPSKDLSSFNIMISGYSSTGKTLSARSIFDNMAEKDIVSWNSMILAYIQGEDMERACDLFREMPA
uniref:Pentatricopeptide repeat-containing protein n=1 Tax=Salix viminalis TaxID=40686 RepID=A0A6N2NJY8_SALVM